MPPGSKGLPPHAGTGGRRGGAALAVTAEDVSVAEEQAPQPLQRRNSLRKASVNMRRAAEVVSTAAAAWPLTAMSFTLKIQRQAASEESSRSGPAEEDITSWSLQEAKVASTTCVPLQHAPSFVQLQIDGHFLCQQRAQQKAWRG